METLFLGNLSGYFYQSPSHKWLWILQKQTIIQTYALITAILGGFAVITQYVLNLQAKNAGMGETTVRFFSYFTITSNILVLLGFVSVALNSKHKVLGFLNNANRQTALTVYILVVGLVYNIALRSLWHPQGLQLPVDEILHVVIPALSLLFWIIYIPKKDITWNLCFHGLLYPLVYTIFIAISGYISGFYPYPFINVTDLGYEKALLNGGVLLIVFMGLFICLIGIGKIMSAKKA